MDSIEIMTKQTVNDLYWYQFDANILFDSELRCLWFIIAIPRDDVTFVVGILIGNRIQNLGNLESSDVVDICSSVATMIMLGSLGS
jgi:hypothetical protein